jgi:hypothetical protein
MPAALRGSAFDMREPVAMIEQDAQAFLALRIGDKPLVPAETRSQGPRAVVAAALERLAAMRRERAPVLHRRSAQPKACSVRHSGERSL